MLMLIFADNGPETYFLGRHDVQNNDFGKIKAMKKQIYM